MSEFDLSRWAWVYAGVGIASLAVVLIAGAVTNGSKLAFSIAGVSFQPSEFVKIVFVFCVASLLAGADHFGKIVLSAAVAAVHVLILVFSRDLGSALIFFVAYVIMLYCATGKAIYPLFGLLFGVAASVAAYHLFSHVQVRVQAWKDPWSVIDGDGYQITQSLFAIGCGNWFGLGICQGAPQSIPFVETDFVFSAIAEELGVIFAVCLILVCVSCFMMFMNMAMQMKESFSRYVVLGLGITYIFQIFLTIGGGTKFIPLTGVTLPFISYGGSSVLATFLTFTAAEGLFMLRMLPEEKARGSVSGEEYDRAGQGQPKEERRNRNHAGRRQTQTRTAERGAAGADRRKISRETPRPGRHNVNRARTQNPAKYRTTEKPAGRRHGKDTQ